mgnify:CR=1 FL=1
MPIQQMIHEFITVQMHTRDIEEANYDSTAERLYIDIANALKAVVSVTRMPVGICMEEITATMIEPVHRSDSTKLDALHAGRVQEIDARPPAQEEAARGRKKAQDEFGSGTREPRRRRSGRRSGARRAVRPDAGEGRQADHVPPGPTGMPLPRCGCTS